VHSPALGAHLWRAAKDYHAAARDAAKSYVTTLMRSALAASADDDEYEDEDDTPPGLAAGSSSSSSSSKQPDPGGWWWRDAAASVATGCSCCKLGRVYKSWGGRRRGSLQGMRQARGFHDTPKPRPLLSCSSSRPPSSTPLAQPGLCADTELMCRAWAQRGECAANPLYMVGSAAKPGHCRASCKACIPGGWRGVGGRRG
jgi:hypothetical protein